MVGAGTSGMSNPWKVYINGTGKLLGFLPAAPFSIIASANMALDEFFMLSAFFATLKIVPLIRAGYEKRSASEEVSQNSRQTEESGFKAHKVIP
jgi:hypothetical protein